MNHSYGNHSHHESSEWAGRRKQPSENRDPRGAQGSKKPEITEPMEVGLGHARTRKDEMTQAQEKPSFAQYHTEMELRPFYCIMMYKQMNVHRLAL